MIPLTLEKLFSVMDINIPGINNKVIIKNAINNVAKIHDDTLVFHLRKKENINWERFKQLKNCYIITDEPLFDPSESNLKSIIHVPDLEKAYWKFVTYYRSLFNLPVVAITGTCGKTTTKEIIKQVLEKKYNVKATRSNCNALSFDLSYLTDINNTTEIGVFETAVSYPGNLLYGCRHFSPNIGIITNIGYDHLEGCKNLDNYIKTKGEILAGLRYQGTLLLNADDENIKKINLTPFKGKIIYFGMNSGAHFQATNITYGNGGMNFILKWNNSEYPAFIPGYGKHNVYNALAALVALATLGMDINEAIKEMEKVVHIERHLEFHKGLNDSVLIDDTWSSNPTSLEAAFQVMKDVSKGKKKIVVLGKISLLGDYALEMYDKIGEMVVDYEIDFLITKGSFARNIAKSALKNGMDKFHVYPCKNAQEIKQVLYQLLNENSLVLFKVSQFDKDMMNILQDFKTSE